MSGELFYSPNKQHCPGSWKKVRSVSSAVSRAWMPAAPGAAEARPAAATTATMRREAIIVWCEERCLAVCCEGAGW